MSIHAIVQIPQFPDFLEKREIGDMDVKPFAKMLREEYGTWAWIDLVDEETGNRVAVERDGSVRLFE